MTSPRSPMLRAAALLLLVGSPLLAAPKKQGFDAYALLRTRNIFDPERQPGAAPQAPVQRAAPTRADFAALTGVLITPEKSLAFFSGSRTEYSGVLTAGKEIAGARLILILPDAVEIERGGKRTLVAVGQTVPLDANSLPAAAPAPSSTSSTTSTPSTPSASAPAPANRDEIIRRMMEKRQKDLQ